MTLQEIRELTKLQLIEDGVTFLKDNDIDKYTNKGIKEIAIRLPTKYLNKLQSSTIIPLTGSSSYPLPFNYLRKIALDLNGERATFVEWEEFPKLTRNYYLTPSSTSPYYSIIANLIYIKPNLSTGQIYFWFIKEPQTISSTDEPELPEFSHHWLVYYNCYMGSLREGESQNAFSYLQKFESMFQIFLGEFVKETIGKIQQQGGQSG
jgi:hypothetical protein